MSKKYFVITLFCFCISLSIYVSYLILIKEINACDVFRKDNITDLLGIIISCISIVFAGYCVILAIDAYGKIKAIKEEAEEAKHYRDSAFSTTRSIGYASISFYEYAINLTEMANRFTKGDKKDRELNKKWRADLHRGLYRLGLTAYMLDEEKRIEFIRNLKSFAEKEDLEKLREIYESKTESDKLKKVAKEVLIPNNEDNLVKPSFCHRFKIAWGILFNKY